MGLKKGMTNNPTGRPKGTKNKVSTEMRSKIADFLNLSLSDLIERYHELRDPDKIKLVGHFLPYALHKLDPEEDKEVPADQKIIINYVKPDNEK
tara:strand:+ start:544 stop:825 length:282 start_codon:yes stop_codon:yes gene_type:complete